MTLIARTRPSCVPASPARAARRRRVLSACAAPVIERLECRRLFSAYFSYDLIAKSGDATTTGYTISSFDANSLSMNDSGRIAVVANLTGASTGKSVLSSTGSGAPQIISFAGVLGRKYSFTQINNAGKVVAHDSISGVLFERTWDSASPGAFNILTSTNDDEPIGAGTLGAFDIVQLPSIANNGAVTFIGNQNDASLPNMYRNATAVRAQNALLGGLSGSGYRPMTSDPGRTVVQVARSGGYAIQVFSPADAEGNPYVAGPDNGFTSVGQAPGISDDGKVIAFVGDRGNGPGVFLSFYTTGWSTPIRVAGENTGGGSVTHELGYDAGGNGLYFSSFDLASRVGVVHGSYGAAGFTGDTVEVTFSAAPNAASVNNPVTNKPMLFSANSGLWAQRVDLENDLTGGDVAFNVHPAGAIPVVQIGDPIGGGAVTGFGVYDPLALAATDLATGNARTLRYNDYRVAFLATTASGTSVVRASHVDGDGDGLPDHWEKAGGGIDVDGDGVVDLDLNAMGADPNKRDLFIEADWTRPRTSGGFTPWSNEPPPGSLRQLVNMFAAAPALANGVPAGVTVHVDAGPGSDYFGNARSINMGAGSLQGGDLIGMPGTATHPDLIYFGASGSAGFNVPGVKTMAFTDVKNSYFGTADKRARELAFHYTVLADFFDFDRDGANTALAGAVSGFAGGVITAAAANFPTGNTGLSFDAVMITGGAGAGQVRTIAANTATTLSVTRPWTTSPDATSTYAILSGSSGIGEVAFYNSPDNNSVPGNDNLLTFGGFDVVNNGYLGNAFLVWRTQAHELGHTLGLRHGGTDHNSRKGNNYLSLMSYDHQTNAASPVVSYSNSADPTFDDWANLKLDFSGSLVHMGSSLNPGLGVSGFVDDEPAMNFARMNAIAPLDRTGPALSITSPPAAAAVLLNSNLTVNLTSSDTSGIDKVVVTFDVNGDGTIQNSERVTATPTGTNTYSAVFNNVGGPAGSRTVDASSSDIYGNTTPVSVTVSVSATPPKATRDDFNGDGKSDVLVRKTDGTTGVLLTGVNPNWKSLGVFAAASWDILGTGDFNADGKADLLVRAKDAAGTTGAILTDQNPNWKYFGGFAAATWDFVGIGDYNADGKADFFLRSKSAAGVLGAMVTTATTPTWNYVAGLNPSTWEIPAVGDFNGDGKAEPLLRSKDSSGLIGSLITGGAWTLLASLSPAGWNILDVGDVNADSKDDILVRTTDNTGTTGFLRTGVNPNWLYVTALGPSTWLIPSAGNFGGDSKVEILLRNTASPGIIGTLVTGGAWTQLASLDPVQWNVLN